MRDRRFGDFDSVTVEGMEFVCQRSHGFEYGDEGSGFPFLPLRHQEIIDGEHAWFMDAEGIVWILENGSFSRPCLRFCLDYIRGHHPRGNAMAIEVIDLVLEAEREKNDPKKDFVA